MNILMIKKITIELASALGVLALMFLSFAYSPANASMIENSSYLSNGKISVFCGQGPLDDGHSNWRCDECRLAFSIEMPNVFDDKLENLMFLALVEVNREVIPYSLLPYKKSSYPRAPPYFKKI